MEIFNKPWSFGQNFKFCEKLKFWDKGINYLKNWKLCTKLKFLINFEKLTKNSQKLTNKLTKKWLKIDKKLTKNWQKVQKVQKGQKPKIVSKSIFAQKFKFFWFLKFRKIETRIIKLNSITYVSDVSISLITKLHPLRGND